jgi:hypothetical protein
MQHVSMCTREFFERFYANAGVEGRSYVTGEMPQSSIIRDAATEYAEIIAAIALHNTERWYAYAQRRSDEAGSPCVLRPLHADELGIGVIAAASPSARAREFYQGLDGPAGIAALVRETAQELLGKPPTGTAAIEPPAAEANEIHCAPVSLADMARDGYAAIRNLPERLMTSYAHGYIREEIVARMRDKTVREQVSAAIYDAERTQYMAGPSDDQMLSRARRISATTDLPYIYGEYADRRIIENWLPFSVCELPLMWGVYLPDTGQVIASAALGERGKPTITDEQLEMRLRATEGTEGAAESNDRLRAALVDLILTITGHQVPLSRMVAGRVEIHIGVYREELLRYITELDSEETHQEFRQAATQLTARLGADDPLFSGE